MSSFKDCYYIYEDVIENQCCMKSKKVCFAGFGSQGPKKAKNTFFQLKIHPTIVQLS